MYLKTPQIKPKKSTLNPVPINLGSISCIKKKTRFNLLNNDNNIIKDIISEGENEESNEFSYDSSSDFTGGEEIKDNQENQENSELDNIYNNEDDYKENVLACKKLKSENTKYEKEEEFKIEEENDDFDEYGKISLRNIRKDMIQSKKKFSKNDNDIFNKIRIHLGTQEDILQAARNVLILSRFHDAVTRELLSCHPSVPIDDVPIVLILVHDDILKVKFFFHLLDFTQYKS